MENEFEQQTPETPAEPAREPEVRRPGWQIWSARIALVIFILFVIIYYINIARGGR